MALQGSGSISLSDIQTEFGGTNPISISEYYGSGGVAGSGVLSMNDFYGTSAGPIVSLIHTLNNPNAYDTPAGDNFGDKVAISGTKCIVCAYNEDDLDGTGSGKAYIFDVTTGNLLHTLDNPNDFGDSNSDFFGKAVDIDGNKCIISAYLEDDASGIRSGKAYIYNVSTGALLHTLDNPNAYGSSAYDYFGNSVSISGNYCIVAAYGEDDSSSIPTSGKAYIFNVTTGALIHTLDNPNDYGLAKQDYFAYSVSISGNYCIVGAKGEESVAGLNSGTAYIFNVTTGALVHTLTNPNAFDSSKDDWFGMSSAIDGNYCIVGAHYEDDVIDNKSGKAYIFNVTTGALLHTLDNPNAHSTPNSDYFGYNVYISGNKCLVSSGSEDDDSGNRSTGIVYIFDVITGNMLYTVDNPNDYDTPDYDSFGYSARISGDKIISGAYLEDRDGSGSGTAYIFEIS